MNVFYVTCVMWTPSLLSCSIIKTVKIRRHTYFIPLCILCFWYIFIIPWYSNMKTKLDFQWTKLSSSPPLVRVVPGQWEMGQKIGKEDILFSATMACRIPPLHPYNELMVTLSEKQFINETYNLPPPCVNNNSTKFFIDLDSNLVQTNYEHIHRPNQVSFWKYAVCYFQQYRRDSDKVDFTYILGPVALIRQNVTRLADEHEFVSIWCYDNRTHSNVSVHYELQNLDPHHHHSPQNPPSSILPVNRSHLIYEDHLLHVPIKTFLTVSPKIMDQQQQRKWTKPEEKNNPNEKLSILILGMDTLSRLNFIRSMPTSYKFLKNNLSALDFKMFNSMGWDSWNSLSILLTGHSMAELRREHCFWLNSRRHRLDQCPFIWKPFSTLGYVTTYIDEDLNGPRPFGRSPSLDYDYRDFVRKWQWKNHIGHNVGKGSKVCFGSRLTFKIHLDLMYRIAHRFQQSDNGGNYSRPYFHYSWTQLLTHDVSSMARYGDEPLLNFLRRLKRENLMNNTAIILVGDHGMRYGTPRSNSAQGFFEERLPLLMLVLPDKFRQKYALAMKTAKKNENRLVTMNDVHATLQNFLNLSTLQDSEILRRAQNTDKIMNENEDYDVKEFTKNNKERKKGVSLFLPISSQRVCANFHPQMLETYCACLPPENSAQNLPHNNSAVVKTGAEMMVKEINRRVKKIQNKKCPKLFKLQKMIKAHIFLDFIQSSARPRFSIKERLHLVDVKNLKRHLYEIWIQTQPPPVQKLGHGGQFKAYLTRFEKNYDRKREHWDVLGLSFQFDQSGPHNVSRILQNEDCLKQIVNVEV